MVKADNPASAAGQSPSLLIVGGGIMGLWAAVKAERLGIDTLLIDAGAVGGGASGGLIGALMPHMPDRWNEKKQFQFDALVSLEADIAAIEAETGLSAGYRRSGRIIPLPKPHLRLIAERHQVEALTNWHQSERQFHWHVSDVAPVSEWVSEAAGASGYVYDTLAARASPRAFTALLKGYLLAAKHVRIVEHCGVEVLDPVQGKAILAGGGVVNFGHVIVSAGYQSFPMLEGVSDLPKDQNLGMPVKGQAALLKAEFDPNTPVVFLNGLYVIPHDNGTVAIGSTSEEEFDPPFSIDNKLDVLIEKARQTIPSLAQADVIEHWAGLRPKAVGRDPMVGVHPDYERLVSLTGGFKVSFGLAHRLAGAAIASIRGETLAVPESFTFEHHIRVASGNN